MAYLTFLTGIAISAIAIYYSVMGLAAIFAAAVVPIVIMGTVLEVAKLVTTVWLKQNWRRAPAMLRTYLTISVIVLMLITSMGIFGFLSKAHLDQGVPTSDIAASVAFIDEKIKTERDNIEAARKALAQMDATVDQTISRSTNEQGATRAAQLRKAQSKERAQLQAEIAASQKKIAALNEERAPIAKDLRKVEAEVGPIKYIAALIYGDNPDQNLLEKAVTWVIITIIFVFDPLAVLLLLASQYSFAWARETKKEQALEPTPVPVQDELPVEEPAEGDSLTTESETNIVEEATVTHRFVDSGEHPKDTYGYEEVPVEPEPELDEAEAPILELPKEPVAEEVAPELAPEVITDPIIVEEDPSAALERPGDYLVDYEARSIEHDESDSIEASQIKAAKRKWKEENPEGSLHVEERKKQLGLIDTLPWEEERYVQNSEQSKDSLWQRLSKRNNES